MEATGINIHGEEVVFYCLSGVLYAIEKELTELTIPEGVREVYCQENNMTELTLPKSVKWLMADKKIKGLDKYIGKVKMFLY